MKKKIIYTLVVLLVLFGGVLVAGTYLLEANIGNILKNKVEREVNANLDIKDAKLSLFESFPNAEISLSDVSLINKRAFTGDTLFVAKHINLKIGIPQLFKKEGKKITIQNLFVDKANLKMKIDKGGIASYDISKTFKDSNESASGDLSSGFIFDLESYEILNSNISYVDEIDGLIFLLSNFNHKGTGEVSLGTSQLDTNTEALVSLEIDSTNYLVENRIKLDALIGIDLKENTYSFIKNDALINQLPLVFNGYVKLNEDNKEVAINFKTSSSDFKNFLGILSQAYSNDIEGATGADIKDVVTTGDFVIEGRFNGVVDDTTIPKFNINVNSDNASFKYPDLPKTVDNIFIDISIANTTGITEDTFVNINRFSFMIDEDTFNAVSKIDKLMGNTKVNAHVDSKLNLANIKMSYPFPEAIDLKGVLNTDITTNFNMAAVTEKRYEDTNTVGNLNLIDFEYKSEEMPSSIKLDSASLTFNPKTVALDKLQGSIGKTDFDAAGTVNNLLGFMFNDEMAQGDFNVKSDTFVLNDFVTGTKEFEGGETYLEADALKSVEKIKIPSFLDANIAVAANTVMYDNLVLKDVQGNLRIKDEKAILSDMTTSIFDGNIAFNGEVSTKNNISTFAMKLGMDKLQITETFESLELFKALAPIAQVLKGNFNSDIELSGNLKNDFTPNLRSLTGNVFAKVFTTNDIDTKKAPLLSSLDKKLGPLWIKKLDIDSLQTQLSFKDGKVSVKPFELKYQDIAIVIAGSHTFDKKINYKAAMKLPAKYLGSKVRGLITKIDDSDLEGLMVPIVANIGGNYASPKVTTDINSKVKELTSKLVEIQKQKLTNQGKDKIKGLLNTILGNSSASEKDLTQQSGATKEAVGGILGNIIGKPKKDSMQNTTDAVPPKKKEEVVKDAAKDILGGFLKKKK